MLSVKPVRAQEPSATPTPVATPELELTGAGWLEPTPQGSDISVLAINPVNCNTMASPVIGYEISKGQNSNDITDFANDLIANGFSVGTVNIGSGSIPACVDVLIVQGLAQNLALSSAYTAAEGTLLKAWAASGHGLMLSGDWSAFSTEMEALFQAYGYSQQGPNAVTDVTDTDPVDTSNTWVIYQTDNFTSHPFLSGINSIELLTSSWFSLASNAVTTTDADATPSNQPVMAAFSDGAGCVALIADSNWNTVMGSANGYFKQDNAKLARQMIQWLNSCSRLTLTKSANPNPVNAGQTITYTIAVTNNAISAATNVRITDTVPANTTFVAASAPHSGPDANGVVVWSLGSLNLNGSAVVTMAVQVDNSVANGTVIANTAWAISNEGLTGTATVSVNVLATTQATATGLIWQDLDGDGIYNTGVEPVLPNVTVVVTDSLASVQTLTTDASGRYTATIAAGSVTINVDETDSDLPAGSLLTTANDPGTVSIAANGSGGADFGFQQPQATATGLVWQDLDGNAAYDTGTEAVLPNITVVVTDSLGTVQTLSTDTSGRYTATVTPGLVTINVDETDPQLPANSALTTSNDPGTISIAANSSDGADFGFQPPATVTGLVWKDLNGDTVYDAGTEPLLPNVTVVVTDSLGGVYNLVTDGSGRYNAAVLSGTVTIDVDQTDSDIPANSILTTSNDPTTATIAAGSSGGADFGLEPPAAPVLNLTIQVLPANKVKPGDTLSYTLTYSNSGTLTATNVVITDFIPANTTYISGSVTATIGLIELYTNTNQIAALAVPVTGLIGLIQELPADGVAHQLNFSVRVNTTLIPANTNTIVNQATISSRETLPQRVSRTSRVILPATKPDPDNTDDSNNDQSSDSSTSSPSTAPHQPAVQQPALPVKFLPETGVEGTVSDKETSAGNYLLWFILSGVAALAFWLRLKQSTE